MKLAGRTLSQGMQGRDVRLLQQELKKLKFAIPDNELSESNFSDGTREAVLKFQNNNRLTPTGEVDAETAKAINAEIDSQTSSTEPAAFVVRGQVVRVDGTPVAGVHVQAFDKDMRSEQTLGQPAVTDENGAYEIKYRASEFARAEKSNADMIVRVTDDSGTPTVSSQIIFNASETQVVNLSAGGEVRLLSEYEIMLKEITKLLEGVLLTDLVENSEHQDISFLAGETGFDPQRITLLSRAAQLEHEAQLPGSPGIETRLQSRETHSVVHVSAVIFYGLMRQGVPGRLTALLSETTDALRHALEQSAKSNIIPSLSSSQLDQAISHLQALQAMSLLKPASEGQSASFGELLQTTNLSPEHQLRIAKLQIQNDGVSDSFWSALQDSGEFNDEEMRTVRFTAQLATLTNGYVPLVREVQRIANKNEPGQSTDTLPVGEELRAFADFDITDWEKILQRPQPNGQPIAAPPTTPGTSTEEKIENYATSLYDHIESVLPTAVLTNRFKRDDGATGLFNSVRDDLNRFFESNPDFKFESTPINVYLSDDADQKLSSVEDAKAVLTALNKLQRVFNVTPRYSEINTLLSDNLDSAMAIVNVGQRRFLDKYGEALGGRSKALDAYQKAKRIHSKAVATYMNYGRAINSPDVYAISGDSGGAHFSTDDNNRITPDLTTLFGPMGLCACEQCLSLYSPAAYFVDILKYLNDGPTKDGLTPLQALLNRRPDVEHIELTCENTNTQLPYVDLVNELLEAEIVPRVINVGEGPNIATVLADLAAGNLPASFRSAITSKGYELSDQVSVRPEAQAGVENKNQWIILDTSWAFTAKHMGANEGFRVLAWPQTSWTTNELRANPEHTNSQAYNILRGAVYPWSPPLDLPWETARVYLGQLGISRSEVMESLFAGDPADVLNNIDIAREYLGITSAEADVVTGVTIGGPTTTTANPGPWDFWGIKETASVRDHSDPQALPVQGDWDEVLRRVSILLQQSGLTYRELLELLGTYFINPEVAGSRTFGIISIDEEDPATCLPSKLQIELVDGNVSRADAKQKFIQLWARIHPFARLWRKLGWTIRDLDKAFTAFNPRRNNQPAITDGFLLSLSHIKRLCVQLSVSPLTALGWWAQLDTTAYIDHLTDGEPIVPSLYSTLFNNNAVRGQSLSEDPQTLIGKISENAAAISGGLGISVQDLALLRNDTNVIPFVADPIDTAKLIPDDALTLDNLSRLYRHTTLASALKLGARSYLSTLNLVNNFPFATTEVTVKFVTTVAEIVNSGYTIEELDYLLRHQFAVPTDAAVREREINAALDAMRGDLRKIGNDNTFVEASDSATATSDQNGDLTKKKLALLNWSPVLIDQVVSVLNSSLTYQTKLPSLPANLVIPDSFKNILSYDAGSQLLSFSGTMTTQQQAQLTTLQNADTDFVGAINKLFDAPVAFVARYLRSFSIPISEAGPLTLSANIKFPDSFKNRLYFDRTSQKLYFVGVMTQPELEALQKIAPLDTAYQNALMTLFASPAQRTLDASDIFLTASGAGTDAAAMFDDRSKAPEERFLLLLRKLLPYLRETLSKNAVKQQLAQQLNLTTEVIDAVVKNFVNSPADPNQKAIKEFLASDFSEANENIASTKDAFPRQFNTLLLLQKTASVILKFNVNGSELRFLFESGPGAGWLDLNTLPLTQSSVGNRFDGWLRLTRLFALRDQLPHGDDLLTSLLLKSRDSNTQVDSLVTELSDGTRWQEQDVKAVASSFNLTKSSFADGSGIARVYAAMSLVKRLGSSAAQALLWSKSSVTDDNARDIESVVKARYDLTTWSEKSKGLRDPLRERQRSALVDYLVTNRSYADSNDLYDQLLIDVEMSPCMMTTRIKQAIGSVQLFVQRALMNLESDVFLSQEDAQQWSQWRKQYRVWEANRKVLLYPENWIEPQLRDDKSPFFKDLESELLQNDLTAAIAEDAFLHYLEKLDQVAHLEIAGIYQQVENSKSTLHVFGRTQAYPHRYFYRWLKDEVWSPWEKVDVDIEGDHLLPVVWNRRVYLFWPSFTEKTDQQTKEQRLANEDPTKWWEIRFACSEYKNNKWSPKRISKDPPLLYKKHPSPTVPQDPSNFSFKTRIQSSAVGEQLSIECYGTITEEVAQPPVSSTPAVTTNEELLVTFVKHGSAYNTRVEFKIDNDAPRSSERAKIKVQLRRKNGSLQEEMSVSSDGTAYSTTQVTEDLDCYLVSKSFASFSVSNKWEFWGTPGGLGITVNLIPWSPPAATTDQPPPPPPVVKLMQGLGEFTLDDGNGNLNAVPAGQVYRSLTPQALQTVKGTRIENQNLVEYWNGDDALGSSGILKSTPGTAFRLLLPHQSYTGTNFSFPFFFEDELRSYFITYIPPTAQSNQKVHFTTFFHPTALKFTKALNQFGIDGLLTLANQRLKDSPLAFNQYLPSTIVDADFPREDVDFRHTGSYSLYNWELFFHAPLLIATQLSSNQRFEEAQGWFHYIFDPTSTDSPDQPTNPGPERFWRVKPFYEKAMKGIPTLSDLLKDQAELDTEVAMWEQNPFKPHAIARLRLEAYMKTVVMKYIDNLIAWGDQLFSRDTIESINEATQLYILAARILGKRPEEIPARAKPKAQTYRTLDDKQLLDALSNAVVEIESFMPPSVAPASTTELSPGALVMPFFCLAKNDKLVGYWDTVADRLFKIRHCLNIEGIARSLPIFEPPIDPALLVRAAAAGIDIGSALSDINAPVPHYRFNLMFQKAIELCADVKTLGASLLSALEKRDGETLSLLRAGHETEVLKAVRDVKEQQINEATNTLAGLMKYQDVVSAREAYYTSREFINTWEGLHLGLASASLLPIEAQLGAEFIAAILHLIPDTKGGAPTTIGLTYGGSNIASGVQSFGAASGAAASLLGTTASLASTMGGYQRRQDDWKHQAELATKELQQVNKQIAAAEIRLAIAERELQNHDLQIDNAREVEEFMRGKFTDDELYSWMVGELSRVYFQGYQVAYDVAKRTERAYRHELGLRDSNFIQFGYWDSLRKGLMCGEKLHQDLRRMDAAFMDQNRREYEITKHISLLSVDPMSLVRLKEEQECLINLPEALFDMDYPGHYVRRTKSIGITIPCVTGPYAGVNCTLTQIKSSVRHSNTLLANKYARQGDDPRFSDSFGSLESIVTSGAQNDSGLFETNFRDERFLPFEGTGAISTWRLELPKEFPAFDYNTISDVVLHVRYSARSGGETLKKAASDTLKTRIGDSAHVSMARLFSVKHEFSTEWYRFLNPTEPAEGADIKYNLNLKLTPDRFPFVLRGKNISVKSMKLFLKLKDGFDYADDKPFATHADDDENSSASSFLTTGSPIEELPFRQLTNVGSVPISFFQQVRESDLPSTAASDKTWWQTVKINDADRTRLKPSAIDDFWILCEYSAT